MRKKADRTSQILEILTREGNTEVTQLAQRIGVSQVTMRKDLDELEGRGILRREHGFAALRSEDDVSARLAYHYPEKMRIAQRAADLVRDGDTVMIENGSCCALLAEILSKTRRSLTIITNSAFLASHIRFQSQAQVILLGGICQADSQVMVGPMVRQCAENFFVDRFFLGVDGWSEATGFTNRDQLRAQAVRDMALQCEQAIVLTESEKFASRGTVPLNLKGGVKMVITDDKIDPQAAAVLRSQGIQVEEVSSPAGADAYEEANA